MGASIQTGIDRREAVETGPSKHPQTKSRRGTFLVIDGVTAWNADFQSAPAAREGRGAVENALAGFRETVREFADGGGKRDAAAAAAADVDAASRPLELRVRDPAWVPGTSW